MSSNVRLRVCIHEEVEHYELSPVLRRQICSRWRSANSSGAWSRISLAWLIQTFWEHSMRHKALRWHGCEAPMNHSRYGQKVSTVSSAFQSCRTRMDVHCLNTFTSGTAISVTCWHHG